VEVACRASHKPGMQTLTVLVHVTPFSRLSDPSVLPSLLEPLRALFSSRGVYRRAFVHAKSNPNAAAQQ